MDWLSRCCFPAAGLAETLMPKNTSYVFAVYFFLVKWDHFALAPCPPTTFFIRV